MAVTRLHVENVVVRLASKGLSFIHCAILFINRLRGQQGIEESTKREVVFPATAYGPGEVGNGCSYAQRLKNKVSDPEPSSK